MATRPEKIKGGLGPISSNEGRMQSWGEEANCPSSKTKKGGCLVKASQK